MILTRPRGASLHSLHLRDPELWRLCERFDPRRIPVLAADLLASVDSARLANNPVALPANLFFAFS